MLLNIEAIEAFAEQLRDAVQSHDSAAAARCAMKLSSRRVARELANASMELIAATLKAMDPIKAGRTAGYLPFERLAAVVEAMPPRQGMALLSRIPPDHAGHLFRALPPEKRQKLFAKVDPSMREEWEAMCSSILSLSPLLRDRHEWHLIKPAHQCVVRLETAACLPAGRS